MTQYRHFDSRIVGNAGQAYRHDMYYALAIDLHSKLRGVFPHSCPLSIPPRSSDLYLGGLTPAKSTTTINVWRRSLMDERQGLAESFIRQVQA